MPAGVPGRKLLKQPISHIYLINISCVIYKNIASWPTVAMSKVKFENCDDFGVTCTKVA